MENNFSDRLKRLRGALSYHKFSLKCQGVHERSLQKYETKESEPQLSNLLKIAEGCGVSVGWLAAGEGDMYLDPIKEGAASMRMSLDGGSSQTISDVHNSIVAGQSAAGNTITHQQETSQEMAEFLELMQQYGNMKILRVFTDKLLDIKKTIED